MRRRNPTRILIVLVVLAIGVVGLFFYISNYSKVVAEGKQNRMTPVQEVLSRNLETNYPPTPKEVVKLYSEITRCFYGEEYTDDELIKLALFSRQLFDDELVANQTDDQYLSALRMDIDSWKKDGKVISSYSVSQSTDVNEYTYEGRQWAQLYCLYSIRMGTNMAPITERYLLRKDDRGHWKILGWELVTPGDDNG